MADGSFATIEARAGVLERMGVIYAIGGVGTGTEIGVIEFCTTGTRSA